MKVEIKHLILEKYSKNIKNINGLTYTETDAKNLSIKDQVIDMHEMTFGLFCKDILTNNHCISYKNNTVIIEPKKEYRLVLDYMTLEIFQDSEKVDVNSILKVFKKFKPNVSSTNIVSVCGEAMVTLDELHEIHRLCEYGTSMGVILYMVNNHQYHLKNN